MDWQRDGADWPLRTASRFVEAAGLRWHVQTMGKGPALLLLHGTGASSHSWRALLPRLASHFTVVAPDLPGHGFTAALPVPPTLPAMAEAIGVLLQRLGLAPRYAAGHSAGAALLVQLAAGGRLALPGFAGLNGALLPLAGALRVFAPAAKLLAHMPLLPRLAAWRAHDARAVDRLIDGTGSRLDAEGRALYARLVRDPAHVAGALAMMAEWDLDALQPHFARIDAEVLLVVGSDDRTVPPRQAPVVAARLPRARVVTLPGLGHLAHEEAPAAVSELLVDAAQRLGVLPAA